VKTFVSTTTQFSRFDETEFGIDTAFFVEPQPARIVEAVEEPLLYPPKSSLKFVGQ
jgi:hypothetical protein